ncbi:MAG: hypothetical protein AAFZ52_09690, partial [Bacteroidota bacterium]
PRPSYLFQVAEELARLELPDKALAVYDWAIDHHPGNFHLTKKRAIFQQKQGNKAAARAGFTESLNLLEKLREDFGEERYLANKENLEKWLAELE